MAAQHSSDQPTSPGAAARPAIVVRCPLQQPRGCPMLNLLLDLRPVAPPPWYPQAYIAQSHSLGGTLGIAARVPWPKRNKNIRQPQTPPPLANPAVRSTPTSHLISMHGICGATHNSQTNAHRKHIPPGADINTPDQLVTLVLAKIIQELSSRSPSPASATGTSPERPPSPVARRVKRHPASEIPPPPLKRRWWGSMMPPDPDPDRRVPAPMRASTISGAVTHRRCIAWCSRHPQNNHTQHRCPRQFNGSLIALMCSPPPR